MNIKVSQTSSSSQQKQQRGNSSYNAKKHDDKLSYSNDTSNVNTSITEMIGGKKLKKSYQHRHVIADAAKYGSTTDSASNDNSSRGSDCGDDFKGDGDYEGGKVAARGSSGAVGGGKAAAKSGSSRYHDDIMSVSALGKSFVCLHVHS
jgi:hypothetical protein